MVIFTFYGIGYSLIFFFPSISFLFLSRFSSYCSRPNQVKARPQAAKIFLRRSHNAKRNEICTFAWLGRVPVVTVTAKQSAPQSLLQSHSGVLSAPPPRPENPESRECATPQLCRGNVRPGHISQHFSFTIPVPTLESRKKAGRCILPPQRSHSAIPVGFIARLFVFVIPRTPAPPPQSIPPSSSLRTRGRGPSPLGYRCGSSYPLKLKSLLLLVYKTTLKSFSCSPASSKPTFN